MQIYYIILLFAVLIWIYLRRIRSAAIHQILQKRNAPKERESMQELAQQFLGKQCIIYTILSSTVQGTLQEVSKSGLLIDNNGMHEAVNLDYVVRLQEIPPRSPAKKRTI